MMKRIFPWLGLVVIGTWVITFLIALRMMWHPSWMSTDSTPLSEAATTGVHYSAVSLGVLLGLSLLWKAQRNKLTMFQKLSYMLSFGLALVSLWRIW